MNKNQFLTELNQYLTFLTPAERAEVIAGYTAKFDAVGTAGEASLALELGTPTMIAIDLKRQKEAGKTIAENAEAPIVPDEAAPEPEDEIEAPDEEGEEACAADAAPADAAPAEASAAPLEPLAKRKKSVISIIACSLLSIIIGVLALAIAGIGVYLVVIMGNLLLAGLQTLYQVTNALLMFGGGLVSGALGLVVIWFALWSAISLIKKLFKAPGETACERKESDKR